ncbi:hypothetical protein [Rugamonas aquatica]|uniref:CopG-like ribbon-helix-helix domain-containing protein n=1 Tax=Rugamonas aquatica TaxID=2743357 RepID=A0A6A7MYM6_9BURK|nr:hypothetical protein [Rugamonas aquatica]MQA37845.1 hypothetical protein [Rugamonas aquatica]
MLEKYTPFHEPHQQRRTVQGDTGALERGIIMLPPATWRALNRLSKAQQRTGSDIIGSLINLADKAQGGGR